jgi:hypothetical protein
MRSSPDKKQKAKWQNASTNDHPRRDSENKGCHTPCTTYPIKARNIPLSNGSLGSC